MNGFTRHAGTADYASDGENAGKRVKVAPRSPTPPPPPPPPAAALQPLPQTSAESAPGTAVPDSDGSRQNSHPPGQPVSSDYLPPPPGLGDSLPSSTALPVYDPFAGGIDPAEAMDIDGASGTDYVPRSTSLSSYVPLEPLPPPPAPSPGGLAGRATAPAPVGAIAANPGFSGAGRRSTAGANGQAAAPNGAEAAPTQPTELVPADVDTLLRCVRLPLGRTSMSEWIIAPESEEAQAEAVLLDPTRLWRTRCRRGKLCLVLDLDHTVVNSAKFSEVTEPELAASLQAGALDTHFMLL